MTRLRIAGETGCAVPGIPPAASLRDNTAEEAVLSGLLHSPDETRIAVSNVGLESGDFYSHRNARAFDAFMYCAAGRHDGDLLIDAWVECYRRGHAAFDFPAQWQMAVWFYDIYCLDHWFHNVALWEDKDIKDYDAWLAFAGANKVKSLAARRLSYYEGVERIKLAFE